MIQIEFAPGPPPDGYVGLLLVTLASVADGGESFGEYHGEPVAVAWYGHKGKTTLGAERVNPCDVASHAVIQITTAVAQ